MTFATHFESPLSNRYASKEMSFIFSPKNKYITWRELWIALAKGEKKLGLPISAMAIKEMETQKANFNAKTIATLEKKFRHDVVAHIHAYSALCPKAKPIIHLGATSCYVTDNTDLILMREGLALLLSKLTQTLSMLGSFAKKHSKLPCVSYTHLQPAQPTTVGKRVCLWLQDLLMDAKELKEKAEALPFLGVKGATGTQASFLTLFDGNEKKVKELDHFVAKEMGFGKILTISSQTYSRKIDQQILSALASMASGIHKIATDIRLLVHLKELDEPFQDTQVGSSAMPHKRNPIRSERICSLARYLISLSDNGAYTAATQWLERTLDDSASRRCYLPEAFLTADTLLNELFHLISGLVLYPKMMKKHLEEELPFLALEQILMEAVKQGGDRQKIHDLLKKKAIKARKEAKESAKDIDFFDQLVKDPKIPLSKKELSSLLKAESFVGRAPAQVIEFLKEEVMPLIASLPKTALRIPHPSV